MAEPRNEYLSPDEMRARGYDRETVARQEFLDVGRKEARELIADIERAFVNISRPKITLRVGRALDDEVLVPIGRAVMLRSYDPEEDWRELEEDLLLTYREIFYHGDDESVRFYLPAWMRMELTCFCDGSLFLDTYGDAYSAINEERNMGALTQAERALADRYVALVDKYR